MTREEAIADIKNNIKPVVGGKSLDMAIEALSANAVDLVRCKDCKYRKKVSTSYYCELDEFNVKDADFCSWGERRKK